MSETQNKKMFNYFEGRVPKGAKFSYFGNNFGTVSDFSQYIDGYKLAAELIFDKYKEIDSRRTDYLDTLVFPLCFLYRQIVELSIKYLFLKYSNKTTEENAEFIKAVSHDLLKAWERTKICIKPLLEKMNSSINLELMDSYIEELNEFDKNSFKMRYPIKKDLSNAHDESKKLDVELLNERMKELIGLFDSVDRSLNGIVIDNVFDEQKISNVIEYYNLYKTIVKEVFVLLKDLSDIELLHKPSNLKKEQELRQLINSMPSQSCAVVSLLLAMGRLSEQYRVAVEEEERKKDILKILEYVLDDTDFISFKGDISNEKMCEDIFEKGFWVSYHRLKLSLELIDSI